MYIIAKYKYKENTKSVKDKRDAIDISVDRASEIRKEIQRR